MGLYEDDTPNSDKDRYYEDQARKAIQVALLESHGKSPEEIRFAIRRSYPFEALRRGKQYKVWNRLCHETENQMGLEPRKHKR